VQLLLEGHVAAVEWWGAALALGAEHEIKRITRYNGSLWKEARESFKEGLVLAQRGTRTCVFEEGETRSSWCVSTMLFHAAVARVSHDDRPSVSEELMVWAGAKGRYRAIVCCTKWQVGSIDVLHLTS